MATWANLAGSVLGYIRLGLSGVRLKNSSGSLSVRNAGDSADAVVLPQSLGTGTRTGVKLLRDDGVWVVPPASSISNNPAGTIAATTVQAAIDELDTEKALLAGSSSQNFSCRRLGVGASAPVDQYGIYNTVVIPSGSAVTQIGNVNNVTMSEDATTFYGYDNYNYLPALEFTLTTWINYNVRPGSLGVGAIVSNRYGFYMAADVIPTNSYAFVGANAVTPEDNVGTTSTITEIAVTSNVVTVTTVAAHGLTAGTSRVTVAPTINTQLQGSGILVASTPSSTTFTYSRTTADVTSDPAETGSVTPQKRWNLYMSGTAPNYLNGALLIGATTNNGVDKLQVTGSARISTELISNSFTMTSSGGTSHARIGNQVDVTTSYPVVMTWGTRNDANAGFGGKMAIGFRRSDGTAIATSVLVGKLGFGGQWGTDTTYQEAKMLMAASVCGISEGSYNSATDMPTGLSFRTGVAGSDPTSFGVTFGTERMRIFSGGNIAIGSSTDDGVNKLQVTGSIKATTGITSIGATAGIGYGTGAGGAVTQITSRTTAAPTINKVCGKITTHTASLAIGEFRDFVVPNSTVAVDDVVIVNMRSGSNSGHTFVDVVGVAAGSFTIRVSNENIFSSGTADSTPETGAIIINFAVIKGVVA